MGEHEAALVLATCADCGAQFRVRARERGYSCTKCGGVVHAAPPGPPKSKGETELAACANCHAVLPLGVLRCPECGLDSRAGGAADPPPNARERKVASRELQQAGRTVEFVRNVLWVPTFVFFLLSLTPIHALTDPRTSPWTLLAIDAVFLVPLLFCLVAVAHIALSPFEWTLTIAVLATISFALQLAGIALQGRLGAFTFWITAAYAVMVVGLWLSLPSTVKVRRLLERHSGEFAARSLLGVVAPRDVAPEELRELAMRAAWKRAGIHVAIAVGVLALSFVAVWAGFRPRPLERTLQSFTNAWNHSELDGVVASFSSEKAAAERARLEKVRAARGWSSLPVLVPATGAVLAALEGPQVVRLHLQGSEECVTAAWSLSGAKWELTRLDLPPPPIGPAVELFTRAWNASDADRLSELFAASSRERFRAYFDRLIHARKWTNGLPRVSAENTNPRGPGDADVWMATEQDRFLTLWHVDEDDHWVLVSFEAPKK